MQKIFIIGFTTLCITIGLFYVFNFDILKGREEVNNNEEEDLKIINNYRESLLKAYKLAAEAQKNENDIKDKIKLVEEEAKILEETIRRWNIQEKKDHLKVYIILLYN